MPHSNVFTYLPAKPQCIKWAELFDRGADERVFPRGPMDYQPISECFLFDKFK